MPTPCPTTDRRSGVLLKPNLVLVKHSPSTASYVKTVTSGITMNFGGKVGFSKAGLPTPEISAGVTIHDLQFVGTTVHCSATGQTNQVSLYT